MRKLHSEWDRIEFDNEELSKYKDRTFIRKKNTIIFIQRINLSIFNNYVTL